MTYFFRRIFNIIKVNGFQSLIATNTIAQGNAREDGLDVIVSQGGTINHAVKSMKWPGIAAVEVALVTITKQPWKGKFVLDTKEVKTITPYLDDAATLGNPFSLLQNESKSFQGSIVLGKGFVLEPNEAKVLIEKDSRNKDVLFPYLNGDDLNNNPDQRPSRWVINFFDWNEERAQQYPDCYKIIEQLVKPERQRWTLDKDGNEIEGEYALRKPLPEKWWIYADKRPALYRTILKLNRVLVVPRVTKYPSMSFVNSKSVFHDKVVVLSFEKNYEFLVLQSSFHDEWAKKYSSTLGGLNNLNYSPSECLESFAFPQSLRNEKELNLENIGETYHELRRHLMLKIQLGLTKTYNAFHASEIQPGITVQALQGINKQAIEKQYGKEVWNLWNHLQKTPGTCSIEEAIAGIVKLRELHVEMDNAVLEAYGWAFGSEQPIELKHDFYEVDYLPENDRIRFTIHPDARKEILKRLLELNHRIHAEEVVAGLWDKKTTKSKEYKIADKEAMMVKDREKGLGDLFADNEE